MKRRLFKLVVFLLLGAVVNVAVAWGCVTWSNPPTNLSMAAQAHMLGYWGEFEADRILLEGLGWNAREETPDSESSLFAMASKAPGLVYRAIAESPRSKDPKFGGYVVSTVVAYETRAGWPTFALQGVVWNQSPLGRPPQWRRYMVVNLVNRPGLRGPNRGRWLPLRPIWPGFAINTIFYAAVLWLLTLGPFTARRIIRRKRGRCIKCGYDLRGTPGGGGACPECGMVFCDEGNR